MAGKKPMGRPTKYSEELADKICLAIASTPRGLSHVCAEDGMPSPSAVYKWLASEPDFVEKYLRARETQSHLLLDECMDIADDGTNDFIATDKGPMLDRDHIARSKLRVETRMRMAGKLNPKRYGDKLDLSSSDGSMTPAREPSYKLVD